MPRIVDHDSKRQALAEAAWSLIRKEGVAAVSVRKIAAQAGVSPGSVRHYFNTQAELLDFAMNLVSRRVYERISARRFSGGTLEVASQIIQELLPMDDERRTEAEVWLAFVSQTGGDSTNRQRRDRIYDEMHDLFYRVIQGLSQQGIFQKTLNIELEARRLQALVDGLALHHLITPQKITVQDMADVVENHLAGLADQQPSKKPAPA